MRLIASFLRWFLRHLYHGLAWAYDLVAWLVSLGAWTDWVKSAHRYVEGRRVLELGPGTGRLQAALFEGGLSPFGLDESSQMLGRVRRRLRRSNRPAALTRGLAQSLPFADGCFDSVISTFPTEYILDARTVHSIWRTLKPGGLLVVVPWGIRIETRWLFELTRQGPSMGAGGLAEALRRAGFQVETRVERRPRGAVGVILARKPAEL
jgi:ubiquinone/menaquinone biosynthesis C-methylase UbiE